MKKTHHLQLDITADHIADLVGQLIGEKQPDLQTFVYHVRQLLNLLPGTPQMIRMDGNIIHVTWIPQGEEFSTSTFASLLEKG